jgi:hypothetical protein
MIEAQGRVRLISPGPSGPEAADPLAALAEEREAFQERLPDLLREHEGKYVLIKGTDLIGVYRDRSQALSDGYQRFGVIPFLVRQIAASAPVVYLPNVVP